MHWHAHRLFEQAAKMGETDFSALRQHLRGQILPHVFVDVAEHRLQS